MYTFERKSLKCRHDGLFQNLLNRVKQCEMFNLFSMKHSFVHLFLNVTWSVHTSKDAHLLRFVRSGHIQCEVQTLC